MTRVLAVWWDGRLVGHLKQNEHGDLGFVYAASWLDDAGSPALSVSLPRREKPFSRRECRPFFSGLLPEQDQREAAAQALGVSAANDFALLDHLGGDVAGALQLLPPGAEPAVADPARRPVPLDEEGIIELLDTLPRRPFLVGAEGLRLSLAGAQAKMPVVLVDGKVALPVAGQPTTHILKPPITRFAALTGNEAFVMRLAAAVGLEAAAVEPRIVRGRAFLLVERYDRAAGADGVVHRIHQEDFCQALGVPPERKYAAEGGPTFRDGFALLRRVSTIPAVDVLALVDAAIFNAMVGNADAHGKNFSLLHDGDRPRLAPLYDLVSTAVYPELSPRFAMKIGGRATLGELDARAWRGFAADAGVSLPRVRQRVRELGEAIAGHSTAVAADLVALGLERADLEALAATMRTRAAACTATLA